MSQYVYLPDGSQAVQIVSKDDKVIYPFDKQAQLKTQIENNTTPLGANATYTGATFDTMGDGSNYTWLTGLVFANQSGTLYIDQSGDGSTFEPLDKIDVTGGSAYKIDVKVLARYIRFRYANGASAQSAFRLFTYATFLG